MDGLELLARGTEGRSEANGEGQRYVTFFGTPTADGPFAWRFAQHHLTLIYADFGKDKPNEFGPILLGIPVGNLASHLHGVTLPKGFTSADVTPAVLSNLPAVVHQGFVAGYAESIQTVFLVAVPIAALAFLATWLIPQVELKRWPEAAAASPDAASPDAEMTMASVTAAPEAPAEEAGAQVRSAGYTERT